jgi:hypothetical protein
MYQSSLVNVKTYNMMKKIIPMILAMLFAMTTIGQTVKIVDVTSGPDNIGVDIDFSGFTENITTVTFHFDYDLDLLAYTHFTNLESGGVPILNPESEYGFAFNWNAPDINNGVAINGTFITLHFDYVGAFTNTLNFVLSPSDKCEIGNIQAVPFNTNWENGTIYPIYENHGQLKIGSAVDDGTQVSLPVKIEGNPSYTFFESITDMSLYIGYDPAQLTYLGLGDNVFGFTDGYDNGKLSLLWNETGGEDFSAETTLFNLLFAYNGGGDASVEFLSGSVVRNQALPQPILNVNFQSGGVVQNPNLAQQAKLGTFAACEHFEVEIPVTFEGMPTNLGAFDLVIEFDPQVITYSHLNSVSTNLSGTFSTGVNVDGNVLTVEWLNANNTNDLNGLLFNIVFQFQYDPNVTYDPMPDFNSAVSFVGGSIIRTTANDPVPTFFENGSVIHARILNIEVLLEGLYLSDGLMRAAQKSSAGNDPQWAADIADVISVQLRNASNYADIVWSDDVFLSTTGEASVVVPFEYGDPYWLTIKHRTHLETVSNVTITLDACETDYNFFDAKENAYGENQKFLEQLLTGKEYYGIFVGDLDDSGEVDIDDIGLVISLFGQEGYTASDVDGTGEVDIDDTGKAVGNFGREIETP